MAPLEGRTLRFVLFNIRIDDARDVVLILFDFFEQCVVFFLVLVFDLVLEVLVRVADVIRRNHLAVVAFGFFGFFERHLFDSLRGFRLFGLLSALGLLFLRLLALGLLGLLVLGDGRGDRFRR